MSLGRRTALVLETSCSPLIEVGPGSSGLRSVREDPPGRGPLAAVAAGWDALLGQGWTGPVLVVATDLPRLSTGLVSWLAGHPADRALVPVSGSRVQPLCARYRPADLARAAALVASGKRAMSDLISAIDPLLVAEEEWSRPAGDRTALDDLDTPDDLARLLPRA